MGDLIPRKKEVYGIREGHSAPPGRRGAVMKP